MNSVSPYSSGQEAGLEAIRMALDGKGNLNAGCELDIDCSLVWREGSKRVIIMLTDEDSDLPTNA
jgi:hypothetical protein